MYVCVFYWNHSINQTFATRCGALDFTVAGNYDCPFLCLPLLLWFLSQVFPAVSVHSLTIQPHHFLFVHALKGNVWSKPVRAVPCSAVPSARSQLEWRRLLVHRYAMYDLTKCSKLVDNLQLICILLNELHMGNKGDVSQTHTNCNVFWKSS